jgi:hypothetical protein
MDDRRKSGGERAAVQPLREISGLTVIAPAFGVRWLLAPLWHGEDGSQIGAHSVPRRSKAKTGAPLAASKQSEDGRIPHLNSSFPEFILEGMIVKSGG